MHSLCLIVSGVYFVFAHIVCPHLKLHFVLGKAKNSFFFATISHTHKILAMALCFKFSQVKFYKFLYVLNALFICASSCAPLDLPLDVPVSELPLHIRGSGGAAHTPCSSTGSDPRRSSYWTLAFQALALQPHISPHISPSHISRSLVRAPRILVASH